VVAGPGCPVCCVPAGEIDEAIWLALNDVVVVIFGDMLRVPSTQMSLADARASGGDVRVVYSVQDAVKMAKRESNREFVFFAIGFETTAPTNTMKILRKPPRNFSFLVSHRLIPPVMELMLGIGDLRIDGFVAPGHVATIIGAKAFELFPKAYWMPTIVAGFEPLDVLFAILMLLRQIKEKDPRLENEYTRAVTWEGNVKAQTFTKKVFDVVDGRWRGIGRVPLSALKLKRAFSKYDAREKYDIETGPSRDLLPGCCCHLVMIGKIEPNECPLFLKTCTPKTPMGACMVSSEGTCQIWSRSGRKPSRF
jgi:hydrogenase expression/formation protein HypD